MSSSDIHFFLGLAASLVGAYFTAYMIFKRLWKEKVTQLKLIGFLTTFLVSFFAIAFVIGWLIRDNVPFGR